MKEQRLMEKFLITERRDGYIYRTKSVGLFWADIGVAASQDGEYLYCALSIGLSSRLPYESQFRRVPDDTPITVMQDVFQLLKGVSSGNK